MNKKLSIFFLLLFSASIILTSCRSSKKQEKDPFNSFMVFYDRFHQDSIFQIEHVLFPIEGLPSNADSATIASKEFRWEKENWELHKAFDFEGSDFERQFIPFDDNLILERIEHKSNKYASERRWALMEGDWYLIFYAGLNAVE